MRTTAAASCSGYNMLNDIYVEAHSVQGNNRAARSWEIYNNTFNQVSKAMWVPMFLRGGTGVVFNNTITGTWNTAGIALDNVRDCETREVSGRCDGSSPWDGNQAGQKRIPVPGPDRPVDGQFPVDRIDPLPASGPRSRLCMEQQAWGPATFCSSITTTAPTTSSRGGIISTTR